ncbi:hypothetical protein BH11PLA1_BH11PLA1_01640 [soil metagenome]
MSTNAAAPNELPANAPADFLKFNWKPQPAAQRIIDDLCAAFLSRNAFARRLADRMRDETGTRFKDWIDFIVVPSSDPLAKGLKERMVAAGYVNTPQPEAPGRYTNPLGLFPEILLQDGSPLGIAIKVDDAAFFVQAHDLHDADVGGPPLNQYRVANCKGAPDAWLVASERHGYRGYACPKERVTPEGTRLAARAHLEKICNRRRDFPTDAEGFAHLNTLLDAAIKDIGRDWACDIFFEGERRFWMRRNRAGQVQYARQQKLGLGWANHDHHTYRSSRAAFPALIAVFEKLGFTLRERFYAGAEAQWGAQVAEQAVTGITTFNDVDMSPEELLGDFSHEGFPEQRDRLGTVGLWCALHGEAILQAGMHHLECQFDWHALVAQLERDGGVKHMAPFTTFPYLRQAFTEGERWAVTPARIDAILKSGMIDAKQAELFRSEGALGSHMENLERNDGFKGFNQQGVSDIIARTDARRVAEMDSKAHAGAR